MAGLNLGQDVANKRARKKIAPHKVTKSYFLYLAVRMSCYGSLFKIYPSAILLLLRESFHFRLSSVAETGADFRSFSAGSGRASEKVGGELIYLLPPFPATSAISALHILCVKVAQAFVYNLSTSKNNRSLMITNSNT